jgi:hypothetical protein
MERKSVAASKVRIIGADIVALQRLNAISEKQQPEGQIR